MIHCPGCGAGLRFDIETQMMVCDSCDGRYEPSSTAGMNKEAGAKPTMEAYVFTCPSCGGELLTTDQNDAVGFCPFCGGASMLFDRIHEQWEPQAVIPFKITKEQCKDIYLSKAKWSIFVAQKYKDPKLIESFRGIYMPYWSYKAEHRGSFVLKGKRSGFNHNYYYDVEGTTNARVEGVSHDASLSFDDSISEEIAPYDPKEQVPYAPGYLSGFYAEIADVNAHVYEKDVEQTVRDYTESAMIDAVNNDPRSTVKDLEPDPLSKSPGPPAALPTRIVSAKRTLYPVWFMSYRNKESVTYSVINGQTGSIYAELPVSMPRLIAAILLLGALFVAAMWFILPAIKAAWTLIASSVLLAVGTISMLKQTKFDKADAIKKGFLGGYRALRVMCVIQIVSIVIGVIIGFKDPAHNVVSYTMCVVQMAELLISAACYIYVQIKAARRLPPQFEKKGAAYDEH